MNVHAGATHQVLNQARAATGWNAFSEDAVLQAIVTRSVPWVADKATALGKHAAPSDPETVFWPLQPIALSGPGLRGPGHPRAGRT